MAPTASPSTSTSGSAFSGCGSSVSGSTVGEANVVGNPAGDDLLPFCVSAAGTVTFSTCGGASWDTYLRIYDSVPGTQLVSNDDSCNLQSTLSHALGVGCYVLVVEGFSSNEGAYTVAASCSGGAVLGSTPAASPGAPPSAPPSGPHTTLHAPTLPPSVPPLPPPSVHPETPPAPPPEAPTSTPPCADGGAALCSDGCGFASDGACDDGGAGAQYVECALGDDCADCGARCAGPSAPPSWPPRAPPHTPAACSGESCDAGWSTCGVCLVAVPASECPADPNLGGCTSSLAVGELCEFDAGNACSDGDQNLDQCSGGYDVYRRVACGAAAPTPSLPPGTPPAPPPDVPPSAPHGTLHAPTHPPSVPPHAPPRVPPLPPTAVNATGMDETCGVCGAMGCGGYGGSRCMPWSNGYCNSCHFLPGTTTYNCGSCHCHCCEWVWEQHCTGYTSTDAPTAAPPSPPPPPPSMTCRSTGDPHITTFGGHTCDLMGLNVFPLVALPGLTAHVFHCPATSGWTGASVNVPLATVDLPCPAKPPSRPAHDLTLTLPGRWASRCSPRASWSPS